MTIAQLPVLNAVLNATSATLLVAGLWCIRAKHITAHTGFMLATCVSSATFLASYLIYHAHVGSVHFLGTGWIRPVYFTLLISHSILAMAILPLVLRTLFLAAQKRFIDHRAIARWTWPLWLYVSITGIVVYWWLYHGMPNAEACPGCKEALTDPAELPQRLASARGYALSIGLLLTIPAVLVGGLTTIVIRAARRNRRTSSQV